jgi:hypothetical protein
VHDSCRITLPCNKLRLPSGLIGFASGQAHFYFVFRDFRDSKYFISLEITLESAGYGTIRAFR